MVANFGLGSLVIAFIISLYGTVAAIYGVRKSFPQWIESARLAMLLTFPLISITSLSIIFLLLQGDYNVEFVASVVSNSMPAYLKVTALWGGQAGSLIFWSWLLSAFATTVTLQKWDRDVEFLPWVITINLGTLAFFLFLSIFIENPFTRLWQYSSGQVITALFQPANTVPFSQLDGRGLNPLLRHVGMIIHPPMLYLGYVGFTVPFSFAVASLITGRTDDRWIRITRRWCLVAWLFLSLGLILGARWAYDVLGWGGYWGWDPVEIAAFMPWLSGTAYLHSVVITEKRNMLKRWNLVLIIITYCLVIFGTFLTRSGVLSSVHTFAQSSIGPLFFGFIGISFIISLTLLMKRWDELESDQQMSSLLSRESLFLINNFLFLGILVICFTGVIFPLASELVTGQKITVGPEWYERATGPLFAALLFLMGVVPLSAWQHSTAQTLGRAIWKPALVSIIVLPILLLSGVTSIAALLGFWLVAFVASVTLYDYGRSISARHRSTGENVFLASMQLVRKNRRRYGGYIIHLSVVLMALGIIGIELFQTETQGTIRIGDSLKLGQYSVQYRSLASFDTPDGRNIARAVVDIFKDGRYLGEFHPRRDYYYEAQQQVTIPGVRSTMEDDLYVLLVDWQPISSQGATFKIYHNPLVNWLWLGGMVLILGFLAAAWPDKEIQYIPSHQPHAITSVEVSG